MSCAEYDVIVPLNDLCHKHLDRLLEDEDIMEQIRILVEKNKGPIKINFLFKAGLDGSSVNKLFLQMPQSASGI